MIEFLKKKIDKNQGVPINLENRIQILEQRNDFLEKEIDLKARIWQTPKYNGWGLLSVAALTTKLKLKTKI